MPQDSRAAWLPLSLSAVVQSAIFVVAAIVLWPRRHEGLVRSVAVVFLGTLGAGQVLNLYSQPHDPQMQVNVMAGLKHGKQARAFITLVHGICHALRQLPVHSIGPAQHKGSPLQLLRDRELRGIYIVGILLAAAWDLFTFVTPIRGSQLGFSASTIGMILATFSAAMMPEAPGLLSTTKLCLK